MTQVYRNMVVRVLEVDSRHPSALWDEWENRLQSGNTEFFVIQKDIEASQVHNGPQTHPPPIPSFLGTRKYLE